MCQETIQHSKVYKEQKQQRERLCGAFIHLLFLPLLHGILPKAHFAFLQKNRAAAFFLQCRFPCPVLSGKGSQQTLVRLHRQLVINRMCKNAFRLSAHPRYRPFNRGQSAAGIAEAFYGMPQELRDETLKRLPKDIREGYELLRFMIAKMI